MSSSFFHSTRRQFLRRTACAALGTSGLADTIWNLQRVNAATTAGGKPKDYKALVCLFLYGGNDANNLLVPTDAESYGTYAAARGNLALPASSLLPVTCRTGDGRTYGLHPSMPELQGLFAAGRLAVVANVGTLVAPVTRADFLGRTAALPPNLFSHADQSVQWQTSWSDQSPRTGWGGRMAEVMTTANQSAALSVGISLAGNNLFQTGGATSAFTVAPTGAITLDGCHGSLADNARLQAVQTLLAQAHANVFEEQRVRTASEANADNALLVGALAGAPVLATAFPKSDLGGQLEMIARIIAARGALGMNRQVFFCSVGGFDTHGNQMADQAELFVELSQALGAFHAATVELGVERHVTAFTSSDFGRTLLTNGSGSDHGWGSHHLVVGGAVRGGDLYGTFPTLAVNGPDDAGGGRWIPTTSVDEYAATLARWFGVSERELPTVFPNIGRFARPDVGFMV